MRNRVFWIFAIVVALGGFVYLSSQSDQQVKQEFHSETIEGEQNETPAVLQATDVTLKQVSNQKPISKKELDVPAGEEFQISTTFRLDGDQDKVSTLFLKIIKHKSNGEKVTYQSAAAKPVKNADGAFEAVFDVGKIPQAGDYELSLDASLSKFPYHVHSGPISITKN